jgi:2-polyprenyl-3-methyl-5-hydroxy-6-metoxy-1,4-benzoquinol methylase
VLDVGCGDLEVVKNLDLKGYVGIDQSEMAIAIARHSRPDWTFMAAENLDDVAPADWVLCFEVLIHQASRAAYDQLIATLAAKTRKVLIVSGYERDTGETRSNHMVFFHEPLIESLRHTGRFSDIKKIGAHSDVGIYRCEP